MEGLEHRALLSVTPIAMNFKSLPFNVSGTVVSDVRESGYLFHFTGNANLAGGTLTYDSATHGTVTRNAALSLKGSYSATQKSPNFSGTWGLNGRTANIVDQSGKLSGSVNVGYSYLNIPTMPTTKDYFNGTYNLSKATLNTANFNLRMDLVHSTDNSKITFTGKLKPTGKAFGVVVTPKWNSDMSAIDVSVANPGRPHTTANRAAPVTTVRLYWAKGTSFANRIGGPLADSIPFYWNESTGKYQLTDLPSAPAGASHLLFVTQVDGKTTTKALALPTVSVRAVKTPEGSDPSTPNVAEIQIALSRAYSKDVTVSYKTLKGTKDTATPNSDYTPTSGTITIPAGATSATIQVPITADTQFEPHESFSFRLTQATNAGISKSAGTSVNTIGNDDPVPTLSVNPVSKEEGNSGRTAFTFEVVLSNPTSKTVAVSYATADGTATVRGKDYLAKSGTLTFQPGQVKKTVTVLVNGDTGDETLGGTRPYESFWLNFTRATNTTNRQLRVEGQIVDDDAVPVASLAASHDSALGQMAGVAGLASYFDDLDVEPNG